MAREQVIALRDRLDVMLKEIRFSRDVRPPTIWCPVCNQRTQQAALSVSVPYIGAGSFWIIGAVEAKSLEKRWAKHRKENSLDRNGKPNLKGSTDSNPLEPDGHSHGPTS